MISHLNKITLSENMSKIKFNHRGFIIILLDTITGDKISVYTDLVSWTDAVYYGAKLLCLKKYSNCGLYQITRCVDYGKNL